MGFLVFLVVIGSLVLFQVKQFQRQANGWKRQYQQTQSFYLAEAALETWKWLTFHNHSFLNYSELTPSHLENLLSSDQWQKQAWQEKTSWGTLFLLPGKNKDVLALGSPDLNFNLTSPKQMIYYDGAKIRQ